MRLILCFSLVSALFTEATVYAQQVTIHFQEQAPIVIDSAVQTLANGDFKLSGEKLIADSESPNLNHSVQWTLIFDGDNDGGYNELLIKSSTLKIITPPAVSGQRNFSIEVNFPSVSYQNMILAGGGAIKLSTNADGGQLSCSEQETGSYFLAPLLDGQEIQNPVCAASYCPYLMTATGASTLTNTFFLNQTCQNQNAMTIGESVGIRLRAKITPGETLTTNLSVVAKPYSCEFDFNGDFSIDAIDMGVLLSNWGSTGGICDLNQDGKVDAADLGLLLAKFGAACG